MYKVHEHIRNSFHGLGAIFNGLRRLQSYYSVFIIFASMSSSHISNEVQ